MLSRLGGVSGQKCKFPIRHILREGCVIALWGGEVQTKCFAPSGHDFAPPTLIVVIIE